MSTPPAESRYPTGPDACASDPNCTPWITSPVDPMMLALYVFMVIVVACTVAFVVFRKAKTRNELRQQLIDDAFEEQAGDRPFPDTKSRKRSSAVMTAGMDFDAPEATPVKSNFALEKVDTKGTKAEMMESTGELLSEDGITTSDNYQDAIGMKLKPYKKTMLGEATYLLLISMCIMWFVTLGIIVFDCYNQCQLTGIDAMCFYGNYPVFGSYTPNSYYFFAWWWGAMLWLGMWIYFKEEIRNLCRTPCRLHDAEYMWVWVKDEDEVLVANRYAVVRWFQTARDKIFGKRAPGHDMTVPVLRLDDGTPFFIHEGTRYMYNAQLRSYIPPKIDLGSKATDLHKLLVGLDSREARARFNLMGPNQIPFEPSSFWRLCITEFQGFFYLYQLSMYSVQFWNAYLVYGAFNGIVVIISGLLNVYMIYKNEHTIQSLTKYITNIRVKRDGQWTEMDSRELVPGDVCEIKSDWLLPCDFVILEGSAVLNESGLTGESMPVQKLALPNEADREYDAHGAGARNTLFAGTTVLQAGASPEEKVVAVVTGTGINTSKGDLLSSILYPQRMLFRYDEELVVVITCLAMYAVVIFFLSIYFQAANGSKSNFITKWAFGAGAVNQCMNPLLPVALSIGTVRSAQRLASKGVFCLNPARISISGKIRIFCFDKTGTLTKEGLDFLGVQPAVNGSFGSMQSPEQNHTLPQQIMRALASCHAVARFGVTFVGNQVEVKMFTATGWDLFERVGKPPVVKSSGDELEIVRRFEFDHALQTMSVLVRDPTGEVYVFVKGSFEKVGSVCNAGTLPANYQKVARGHALEGGYVLSIGQRAMGKLTDDQIGQLKRSDVESNIDFMGLIVFRNELKEDTRDAIIEMKQGAVRPVMITGDNAQCGYYIARSAALLDDGVGILLGEMDKGTKRVMWKRMGQEYEDDKPITTDEVYNHSAVRDGTLELAITGNDAYTELYESGDLEQLLFKVRIFARMSPHSKVHAVNMHRRAGIITGMCGDGGNDCGALRAAHAGVALSDAEASIVSPFTGKTKSVRAVVELLLEGRATLHTSFAMYKFLIGNGLILSLTKQAILYYGVLLCIFGYIMVDMVATLGFGYFMVMSLPQRELQPTRPTSSLLGPITMSSVLGVTAINFLFTVVCIFYIQMLPGYVKWPADVALGRTWWYQSDNWETSTFYFTQMNAFINNALVFSFGAQFRRNVLRNWMLVAFIIFVYACQLFFMFSPPNSLTIAMHVFTEQFNRRDTDNPIWQAWLEMGNEPTPAMSLGGRLGMQAILIISTVCCVVYQYVFVDGPFANFLKAKYPTKRPVFKI